MIALLERQQAGTKIKRRPPSRARWDSFPQIEYVSHPQFDEPDADAFVESLNPGAIRRSEGDRLPAGTTDDLLLSDAPLLTRAEERYLFCRMNYLKFTAAQLLGGKRVSRRQRARACDRLQTANALRNQIVDANQRLVISIAHKFATPALTLGELVSDGNLPLIRAVELYDFSRGLSFCTYATHAVRNYLVRTHRRALSRSRQEIVGADAVLATAIDERPDRHELVRAAVRNDRLLNRLLSKLDKRERSVVSARFGLDDGKRKSFRQIGDTLGLSKERARQIAHRSLNKLQESVAT